LTFHGGIWFGPLQIELPKRALAVLKPAQVERLACVDQLLAVTI
jgi:hypothetical protein